VSTSRYHTGVSMSHSFRLPKGFAAVAGRKELSREARLRLSILDYAQSHSVAATCRHFGIARSTYYRWRRRFTPGHLASLESRSSRPREPRRPTWTTAEVLAVRSLRAQYPRFGKAKLRILLREEGITLSVSMVGRILGHLRRTHQLREPASLAAFRPHARHKRPYAIRKPKDYLIDEPGALVQVDTMQIRPLPTLVRSHFTGVDAVSRWSVADVHSVATAATATDYLDQLCSRSPFPIKAIQVDGGSEFMGEFETGCAQRGIALFALPPRSPKLNGKAERTNRTYRNEFYECYDGDLGLPSLQPALRGFEETYNHHRPHQALGYLTPAAFLRNAGYL
jgi:putative transposase